MFCNTVTKLFSEHCVSKSPYGKCPHHTLPIRQRRLEWRFTLATVNRCIKMQD
jgi:hypothetical protein